MPCTGVGLADAETQKEATYLHCAAADTTSVEPTGAETAERLGKVLRAHAARNPSPVTEGEGGAEREACTYLHSAIVDSPAVLRSLSATSTMCSNALPAFSRMNATLASSVRSLAVIPAKYGASSQ